MSTTASTYLNATMQSSKKPHHQKPTPDEKLELGDCINNHLLELLKYAYLQNNTNQEGSPSSANRKLDRGTSKKTETTSNSNRTTINMLGDDEVSFDIPIDTVTYVNRSVYSTDHKDVTKSSGKLPKKLIVERCTIPINDVSMYLKTLVSVRAHLSNQSPLVGLNFNITTDFIVISTNKINENLRHIDTHLDRVLHQTKLAVFEIPSYAPICYLEKSIKESDLTYLKPNNSYLKSYVYDVVPGYQTSEFDKNTVSVFKRHIGSYIIMFFSKGRWYFTLHNTVHEFNNSTHPILFEHIGIHITKFNKKLCYHIVLVDTRIRRLITPTCSENHVVLVRLTEQYTLKDVDLPNTEFVHDVLVKDSRFYVSCLDELQVRMEELDIVNSRGRRLYNRGYIAKIKADNFDSIHISYDTQTYKRLMSVVPVGMSIHEVHLYLYQQDKLTFFLQYITDSCTDVVKRINTSMSTMSRELLDIYHMTRKKKNSELYMILPQSYKQLLYQLHSDYIAQKNKTDTNENIDPDAQYGGTGERNQSVEKQLSINQMCDSDDDKGSGDSADKISISVDNVYTKLKELDMHMLVELYKDREVLIKSIEESNFFESSDPLNVIKGGDSVNPPLVNPIKHCTNTKIQSKLLSMRTPI